MAVTYAETCALQLNCRRTTFSRERQFAFAHFAHKTIQRKCNKMYFNILQHSATYSKLGKSKLGKSKLGKFYYKVTTLGGEMGSKAKK